MNFIRLMTKADIPLLLKIEEMSHIAPWSLEAFERCLQVGYLGWVAEKNDFIIGFSIASFQMNECHILNLCVHPDFRHQGCGYQLLDTIIRTAIEKKMITAILEVRKSNKNAIALYDKAGFVQIGERKHYYVTKTGREDALIFAKDLTVT